MKKNPLLYIIVVFIFILFNSNCLVYGQMFKPDTTINKILVLQNVSSVSMFIQNTDTLPIIYKNLDYFNYDSPFVLFLNKSKTRYLAAIIHEGTWKNCFSEFEIGIIYDSILIKMDVPYIITNYEDFKTESNIYITMSKRKLKKIKGRNFSKFDNRIKYCYRYVDSEFINELKFCDYYCECYFKKRKVVKVRFGYTQL